MPSYITILSSNFSGLGGYVERIEATEIEGADK